MKVEQEKTKAHSVAGSAVMGEREANWKDSVSVAEVLAPLSEGLPRFVARAPGRLDVMGGLAEYTGSLVLNMPVGEHVCVALQRSGDENLSILSAHQASHDGGRPTVIPLRNLHGDDGVLIGAELATEVVEGSGASRARRVSSSSREARPRTSRSV